MSSTCEIEGCTYDAPLLKDTKPHCVYHAWAYDVVYRVMTRLHGGTIAEAEAALSQFEWKQEIGMALRDAYALGRRDEAQGIGAS